MKKRQKKKNMKKAVAEWRKTLESMGLQPTAGESPVFISFDIPYPVRKLGVHLVRDVDRKEVSHE